MPVVRFTKNPPAAAFDLLRCEPHRSEPREGFTYALPREAVLARAAVQFVVESKLGWSDGFFSELAVLPPRTTQNPTAPAGVIASRVAKTSTRTPRDPGASKTTPVAADASLPSSILPLPAPTSVRARQSAAVAACLQAEQWSGASTAPAFVAALAQECRASHVTAPKVTASQLAALRIELRAFGAAWRPLAPGGSLEREFPRP